MKYLIVEDNFSDVSLLKLIIEKEGYDVNVCTEHDAQYFNEELSPNVVQVDGLNGNCFSLIDELRQYNPNAEYLIFSSNRDLIGEAMKREIKFFDKVNHNPLLEYVTNILKGTR